MRAFAIRGRPPLRRDVGHHGDLNGDGRLDLALANANSNSVSVLPGNGDGSFQAGARYGAGVYPTCVTIADLDVDGRLDLAVSNDTSSDVSVLLDVGCLM
jgi:hypothetical protein